MSFSIVLPKPKDKKIDIIFNRFYYSVLPLIGGCGAMFLLVYVNLWIALIFFIVGLLPIMIDLELR